jgi:Arylsulfotransferase (ASST)
MRIDALIAIALGVLVAGCGASPSGASGRSTAADAGDSDASVLGIEVRPLGLVPAFSPSIHDYYVRCASGHNALTLTVTDASGSHSTSVDAVENQELDVRDQYWIRCLPADFPVVTVTAHADAGAPTPGWYLVNSSTYAAVLDTNATPVWYASGTSPLNVDAIRPDTISFMPGSMAPFGYASTNQYTIDALDSLTKAAVMTVGSGTDGHELRLLPNGDYLMFTYPFENDVDLTGLQAYGEDETIADCEVQEIDSSGNLVWSWLATDHVDPVKESIEPSVDTINGTSVVDVFHFNSIEVDAIGNLLLSSRHANALFYVDRTTGTVLWKVGGSPYNKDGATYVQVIDDPQTSFNMQHDARFLPNGDITLFDDHGATAGVARGVEYAIDHEANTATFAFQSLGIAQSQAEGSFRRYADGESVISWGHSPTDPRVITEINADGEDVLDVTFSGQVSYRAIKVPLSQLDIGVLRATTAK